MITLKRYNRRIITYILFTSILFLINFEVFAQKTSKNNYTGDWNNNSSWVGGTAPATTDIGNADLDLNIYGYISRRNGDQSLSFANVNANASGPNVTVNDTLIVYGDMTFANKAANLIVPSGGVLIILGNFSATNKIDVSNGGIFVVAGSMTFSPSGQDEYSGSGDLYAGSISGNGDADAVDNPISQLETDYPEIYNFVQENGQSPLPVEVISFAAKTETNAVFLSWTTTMEENFDYFSIERSRNGYDFQEIGRIFSKTDYSTSLKDYQFTDERPLEGYSYYRLKATDFDGFTEYHGIVSVKLGEISRKVSVYPNPSNGYEVDINYAGSEDVKYKILNFSGQLVESGELFTGLNSVRFGQPLPPGIYFLYMDGDVSAKPVKMIVR